MTTRPVGSHVDDEQLVRLASNEVESDERNRIMDHLAQCEDCAFIWRAVEQVQKAAPTFDPGAVPESAPGPATVGERSLRPATWVALAASVIAALALATWTGRSARVPDPSRVVRSAAVAAPIPSSPGEAERVADPSFSWEGVDGAEAYRLELFDRLGQPLWTSGVIHGLAASWPDSVEKVPGTYFWRVAALRGDGEDPVTSGLVSFELVTD